MIRMMNRMIATSIAMMLMVGTIYADKLPKPDKKQRLQDIQRLIELKNNPPKNDVLKIVQFSNLCFDYCMDSYYRPEEQYVADTTSIQEAYRQNEWMRNTFNSLTEKEVKKYQLEEIAALIEQTNQETFSSYDRYAAMTRFCDRIYAMRRKAATQTMPTGQIKHFIYTEYGASRPDPVYYEIKVDAAGQAMLYGPERFRFVEEIGRLTIKLDKEVLDTIRQKIEKNKLYQELSYYSRPDIPGVIPTPGGPPAWEFTCELEGGKISIGGDQVSPTRGCEEIADYLRPMLEKEWKRRMENR